MFYIYLPHVCHLSSLFLYRIVNVSLPKKTRNNGTLYALIFVHQAGFSPWQDPRQVHSVVQLTTYMVPKPPEISLISGEDQTQVSASSQSEKQTVRVVFVELEACFRASPSDFRSL